MNRIALALFSLASGCMVYGGGPVDTGSTVVETVNSNPVITAAEAGCYWDASYNDYIWYFQASADDPDGVYDVVDMWADVYDNTSGAWVDSFELYATSDAYTWYSDWLGSTTYLDCNYMNYFVEFTAYDSYNATAVVDVTPTYQ